MTPPYRRRSRQAAFIAFTLGCVAIAVGYVVWRMQHPGSVAGADLVPVTVSPSPVIPPSAEGRAALQSQPHLVVINREAPYVGYVRLVSLNSTSPQMFQTTLPCDRMHYAAGKGICLFRDTSPQGDPDTVLVTLFGSDFEPLYTLKVGGFPTRTRVAPDGRYAAFTVFVTGHSYSDANMSTATILLDTASGASLGSLEEFTTWRDGVRFQSPDFNFWGVTFTRDSDQFYATLRSKGVTYLVKGAISTRTLTVLRKGVECPSLSPDGTRLAFKKLTPNGRWRLTVLDLATMQETPLAETESVDDQVEWLDNQRILYQNIDPDPPPWMSVMVVPADGSGAPVVVMPNAISPAAVL
jgi:hypothetical protein